MTDPIITPPPHRFIVTDYGAKGDGVTMNTTAIQAAIDAAHPTSGIVSFPPGSYLTGALFIKSGITLEVGKDVLLFGAQTLDAYPILNSRIAGIEMAWPAALINIYRQTDAHLTGEGVIDGDGKIWWDAYWALRRLYDPKGLRWAADYDCRRPRLIQIFESARASIKGLTLRRSGFWAVHVCYSEDIRISDITVRNNEGGRGPSTDGIDIDSSRRVVLERADIACNDDAICLKAGRDHDGLRVARATEDVVIRDCIVRDGAAGITFGSETSGGFRNVEVTGLRAQFPVPVGIRFKSAPTRGGEIHDIRIDGVHLQDVPVVLRADLNWNPAYSLPAIPDGISDPPDYWRVLTAHVPPHRGLPRIHDIDIRNVIAIGARIGFDAVGYADAPMRNFHFEGLRLDVREAGRIAHARNWRFTDCEIAGLDGTIPHIIDSEGIVTTTR